MKPYFTVTYFMGPCLKSPIFFPHMNIILASGNNGGLLSLDLQYLGIYNRKKTGLLRSVRKFLGHSSMWKEEGLQLEN